MTRRMLTTLALLFLWALFSPVDRANAQTTSGLTGIVKDAQGAVVPGATITAVHEPSGTSYEGISQADGRFLIPGMRVGGPYTVTAALTGFRTETQNNIDLALGVVQDLSFTLSLATIAENITVVGVTSPIFASTRTGAATAVSRDDLATLPTISGRVNDITRLSPQAGGNNTFVGQDNRMNNMTIDGAYFNNPFGLSGNQAGDRTGVAPISLEAIEQIQVNIAPYDVSQGNFVGAGVNMVTRSGTNRIVGSFYSRYRNESFVGTEAAGNVYTPGTFTTKVNGGFLGGPIIHNRLFGFGSFEKQEDVRPLTTYRSNAGGEPVAGAVTRVLASDLTTLSNFLKTNFGYDTGPFDNISSTTPAKPFLMKFDYNLNKSNKINFRYSRLDSSADKQLSASTSAGNGRVSGSNFLGYANSNYSQLENIRSGIGEWNSVLGATMSNNMIVGYTTNNENRGPVQLFPFVDILDGAGVTYTSFGTDPFTNHNELQYHTFQVQDSFTKFSEKHTFKGGGALEKFHSDNVFFQLSNSVYAYNTLQDFYTDANDYLAHPNRTSGPVTPRRFQLGYTNIPGLDRPLQQLDAFYVSLYGQDQFQWKSNVTITGGIRMDMPILDDSTTYANPVADALVFRDENGNPVQYASGNLPDPKPLWSPRVGFNWDVNSDQKTQVRGGTGVFTGKPAYVWISNQIGNTGLLLGRIDDNNPATFRGFNPDPLAYKPPVTGASAASFEYDVTDPNYRFPQTWRSNIAVDRTVLWGMIATGEYLYNKDVNGTNYFNANLPAAQSQFTGEDNRPRFTSNRINQQITPGAYVIGTQNEGRSWILSASLLKTTHNGLSVRGAYSYGRSRNLVDAGTTAAATLNSVAIINGPNDSPLAYSQNSPGHRIFANLSYSKNYFSWGATTVSLFVEAKTNSNNFSTNGSYVFSGDMNGDGITGNDLIYIPANTSQMHFTAIPSSAAVPGGFTVQQQVDAFEAYIEQDPYLSSHRGQYAQRNAEFLPIVKRMDVSVFQDVFKSVKGNRWGGQVRLDITNFGNLLNSNWGVGQRFNIAATNNNSIQILTNPVADANGVMTYRLALVNNQLPTTTFVPTTFNSDVYTMMLSFRLNFN